MEDPSYSRKCVLLSLPAAGWAHLCSQSRRRLSRPQAQSSVPTHMLPRAWAQTWRRRSSVLQRPCGQTGLFPGKSSGYFHGNPSRRDTVSSSHFTEEDTEAPRGKQSGEPRAIKGVRGSQGRSLPPQPELYSPQNCLSSGVPLPPPSPESAGPSPGSARGRAVRWNSGAELHHSQLGKRPLTRKAQFQWFWRTWEWG